MAITPLRISAGSCGGPAITFTMSPMQEWVEFPGGRLLTAGDLAILVVRRPFPVIAGPPGWTQATSNVFYRIIGDPAGEQPPAFAAPGAADWEIDGYAVASTDLEEVPRGGADAMDRVLEGLRQR